MNSMQQAFKADEKIDLSIIIVNHNTRRFLQQCIQSIFDTTDDLDTEVFVVDNASSDGSVEMIRSRFPQVKLIVNAQGLGFARAANQGLAEGAGNYFLIAHPDIKFSPGAVQKMLSFLTAHAQVGVVGANLIYPDGSYNRCSVGRSSVRQELVEFTYNSFRSLIKVSPWLQRGFDKEREAYYWDHQTTTESEQIWNACMMFKREVLETIGGFCEDFYIWFADTDWCYRAKSAGWQMYYLPSAKIIHFEKQSVGYVESEQVRYKTRSYLVQSAVNEDRYTLLKRHFSPLFLWFKKAIDIASLWVTLLKFILLRVFAPSRYRSISELEGV